MAHIEVVAASHMPDLPESLTAAVVARADKNHRERDGEGIAKLENHRALQEAALDEARREVEAELRATSQTKPATDAELASWRLEKLACGKKRTLAAQGELVKAVGPVKAAEIAKAWGIKLGDLTTKSKNPHKAEIKAAKKAAKLETKTFGGIPDTGFNRSVGNKPPTKIVEKVSKNPYKRPMTPEVQKEIAAIINRKGSAFASALAKSAGKTISGAPLKQ